MKRLVKCSKNFQTETAKSGKSQAYIFAEKFCKDHISLMRRLQNK